MHDASMTTLTTLIPLPPDLVHRDRVRRQALRAGAIRHEGLAALRDAAFVSEGLALTWEIPANAVGCDGSTADAAEILRLMTPIAAGLAVLHDAGLAHGGVSVSAIHDDHGVGILTGWLPGGDAAQDVRDVVSVLQSWLPSGSVGADIAQMLIMGADPDPTVRPTMARLAAALERASSRALPPTSPPAHRRARVAETPAPPPRPVSSSEGAPPRPSRGRHAARRVPAGRSTGERRPVPWRWGVAGLGAAMAAFLGFTAVGSAEVECPAAPAGAYVSPAGSYLNDVTAEVNDGASSPAASTSDPRPPARSRS